MAHNYIPYEVYSQLHHKSKGCDCGMTSYGTWGRGAAGILIITEDLNEIMLLKRSRHVQEPCSWGISGGARKEFEGCLEDELVTAVSESREEMGDVPKGKIREQPYVYCKAGTEFRYYTYILEIDTDARESFVPVLNWENIDFRWFRKDSLDGIKLHFGVEDLLRNYTF